MSPQKPSRWLKLFEEFIRDLRISSKEISSSDARGVKLEMWESQRRFLSIVGGGLDDGIRIFNILKSRQLGITTIALALDAFWLAMHPNLTGSLVCDSEKNRDVNRAILEHYVASFPEGYFGDEFKIVKANRQFMQFSNGSRLDLLVAGTKHKAAGWSHGVGYAHSHMTEIGSYGDADAIASFEESFAQQNPDRLFIYEGTARGFNHWRSKFIRGQENSLTERSAFLGWWSGNMNVIARNDPRFSQYGGYAASGEERELVAAVARMYGHKITPEQLAWIRWKEANAGAEQEQLLENQPWTEVQAFVMTGYSFFQARMIGQDIKKIVDSEIGFTAYRYEIGSSFFDIKLHVVEDEEERHLIELKVWEEPVPEAQYVIGFDPAFGRNDHKDRNVIEVYRCFADKLVQVAEYATADHEVKHATWVLAHLAGAYRDCIINHEVNGPGGMVIQEMDHLRGTLNAEMNLKYVESRDWENALGQARWYLFHRPDSMGAGYAVGFSTNFRNKSEIMHQMRGEYVTRALMIRSLPLLDEMRIVVQDGSEIGAPESSSENSKDDRVFATALANRAWINWRRPELLAQGLTYERVMSEESGEASAMSRSLNGQVFRYFKTREEQAEMEPEQPKWQVDRGLV